MDATTSKPHGRTTLFFRLMLVLTLIHVGLFVWLSIDYLFHPLEIGLSGSSPLGRAFYALLVAPVTVVVGILILRHSRGNVVGLLLIIWGIGASVGSARVSIDISLYMTVLLLNGVRFVSLVLLVFYFPDGKAYPRWLNYIATPYMLLTLLIGLGSVVASPTFYFNPLSGREPVTNPLFIPALEAPVGLVISFGSLFGVIILPMLFISPILRYRAADYQVRQQLKWMLFAAVIPFTQVLIFMVTTLGLAPTEADNPTMQVVRSIYWFYLDLFPVVIVGNAILRHHLYDIDIIINRTLVYGALTALVVGIYVLVVGTMSAVFQSSDSFVISLSATGVVAVSFHSLRERLQYLVDHYIYGERNNPYAVLSNLSQRLETITAPGTLLPGIAETVAQAMKLPFVSIALKSGDEFKTDAVYGQPADRGQITTVPLMYGQETVGQMVIGQVVGDKPLDDSQHQLLMNIARQVGTAAHAARLSADLQVSRQRIVTAREEERRRLRRDLHDGLGPALATLTLQAEAARDLIATDPDKSKTLLGEIIAGLQTALADIRRVVYALRPPALDDLGLLSAINVQAAQFSNDRLAVRVELPEQIPPLPAAVEVAAYRIVQEALTNVVHHAQAKTCVLRLAIKDTVQFEIHDDGQGIAEARRAGVGLNAMHERAAELGGTCRIQSVSGEGTHIYVSLPARMEG